MTTTVPSPATISARRLLLRWSGGVAVFLAGAALLVALAGFYEAKFSRTTGTAAWLWSDHRIAADEPEAFFLVRDFALPAGVPFVHIRVAADPEYTLWFNGMEIGGRTADGTDLDRFDVTPLARPGGNRIVLAIRSPRGVGGALATIDLAPMRRNWLVTDGRWRIYREWSDAFLRSAPIPLPSHPPRVLGRPPFGRWNYPGERDGEAYGSERILRYPISAAEYESWLPRIEVKSGVAVAGRVASRAVAFDFGHIVGRPAIRVTPGPKRAIPIRFAAGPEELQAEGAITSLVVGGGEREVTSPQTSAFRYLIVYGEPVEAWVVAEQ
ncbi:MAG TPA: hypothetical protein VFV54_01685 [Thermoanaerobaculia bacterium]|nr:hypothetical protein [Thermoanaerobaculia bacterium]